MTELTNKRVKDTYKQLLKIGVSANVAVSTTLTNIQTGDGTNTALKVATGAVKIAGTFGVDGNASVSGDLQVTIKFVLQHFLEMVLI